MTSLLGGSYPLHDGNRVRLRLARGSDARGLRALLAERGDTSEVELRHLLRYDPRHRRVVCATALIDGRERIVGVGGIGADSAAPELLVADEQLAPGVGALLGDALLSRGT